jgi:hypothetical protein
VSEILILVRRQGALGLYANLLAAGLAPRLGVNAVLVQPELRQRTLASRNLPTGGSANAFVLRIAQERGRQVAGTAWPRS